MHELIPDGRYGPLTDHATARFQASTNLVVDGIAGPTSWRTLSRAGMLHMR
jgi:peptidoglycan hydrolase-like protein with peptidoglycan-binding domain